MDPLVIAALLASVVLGAALGAVVCKRSTTKRIGDAEVLRGKIILARDIRQKRLQKCRDILQVRPRASGFSHESTVQKKRELCE